MKSKDLSEGTFFKSTFSGDAGQCVEVCMTNQNIAVRDSKEPEANILVFSKDEWIAFIQGVKFGEFDIK